MAALRRLTPDDIIHGQSRQQYTSQPSFSSRKPADYSGVKSKCGSTANISHKPGGGAKKIPEVKADYSTVESRTSSCHRRYSAGGGSFKVTNQSVSMSHVTSRTDSGKSAPRKLSDHVVPSRPPSLPRSKSAVFSSTTSSTSPTSSRKVQGMPFDMPVFNHERVHEAIRKLSVEPTELGQGDSDSLGLSPRSSPSTDRRASSRSPATMRCSTRRTGAVEKSVKLPLGLRRYASSSAVAPARKSSCPQKDDAKGAPKLARRTSLDPSHFKQAQERKTGATAGTLTGPRAPTTESGTKPRMRKSASTGLLRSGTTVPSFSELGNRSESTSASCLSLPVEDAVKRDWVRPTGDDESPLATNEVIAGDDEDECDGVSAHTFISSAEHTEPSAEASVDRVQRDPVLGNLSPIDEMADDPRLVSPVSE